MNSLEHKQKSYSIEDKQRLQHNLGFLINGLARMMRTVLEVRLQETGLSPTTWTVIMALGEEDGLSQTDLSKRTFLDNATITRALDQLTELSYIERHRDDTDRRVQLVVLTRKGNNAYQKVKNYGLEINEMATADLTIKTRERFEENIRRIIDRMRINLNNGVG